MKNSQSIILWYKNGIRKVTSYLFIPFLRQSVKKWMLLAGVIAYPIFIYNKIWLIVTGKQSYDWINFSNWKDDLYSSSWASWIVPNADLHIGYDIRLNCIPLPRATRCYPIKWLYHGLLGYPVRLYARYLGQPACCNHGSELICILPKHTSLFQCVWAGNNAFCSFTLNHF